MPIGRRNGRAVLDEALVRELRLLRAMGAGVRALARRFGLPVMTVSDAVRGVTWRHVPPA